MGPAGVELRFSRSKLDGPEVANGGDGLKGATGEEGERIIPCPTPVVDIGKG